MTHTPNLRIVAARDSSQKRLLEDLAKEVETGEIKYLAVLIETDDGETGLYTSALDRPQLVWMLHNAMHSALIPDDEEVDFEGPEAS